MRNDDIFPPYSTIEFLYKGGYYTNDDIQTFVELDCLTITQYQDLTGKTYPKEQWWLSKPENIKIKTNTNSVTIEAE